MTNENIHLQFTVDASPQVVFDAIIDVADWWTGDIAGTAEHIGAEFTYRHEDLHTSRQRVTELVPGSRVAWHVEDATLTFVENTREWVGTDITFDICRAGDQTLVEFNHLGLTEKSQCYDMCSQGWGFFVGDSLRQLIEARKPAAAAVPVTP